MKVTDLRQNLRAGNEEVQVSNMIMLQGQLRQQQKGVQVQQAQ